MNCFLGIDVGSISAKGVLIDEKRDIVAQCYIRTSGKPVDAIKRVLHELWEQMKEPFRISGCATTGSARRIAGVFIGADLVKNEIITHAVAASHVCPDVNTIIEIGGQDSKLIIIRDGIAVDFAMNTVCAAGTGSFLDHQALRLGIPVEEFGALALKANGSVHIASRCTVFAESDMIHKAQLGIGLNEIIKGLCDSIVRNYLSVLAKNKEIRPSVLFQGGVAANCGVRRAFEAALGMELVVPEPFLVMGALGAALLSSRTEREQSRFVGIERCVGSDFRSRGFECEECSNQCEIIEVSRDEAILARYGGRCGKWE